MLNVVAIAGRLTAEPIIRYNDSGEAVCRFTIANHRTVKVDEATIADFLDCKAFGKPCEILEKWFKKGDLIIVSGRLQTDITEKNGYKSKNVYVKVSEISFG